MKPEAYTLALTPRARRFCDALAKHGVSVQHFETQESLIEAIRSHRPTCVWMHGNKEDEENFQLLLDSDPMTSGVKVGRIGRLESSDREDGDDIGTAMAVMTVFDQMPEISDSDPWIRRPI